MNRNIIFLVIMSALPISIMAQTLSLDSCKIYALENNKRLKEAQLQLEASVQVKKDVYTKFFPTVEAGAIAVKFNHDLLEANIDEMNLPVYDGNPVNLQSATKFAYFPGMALELLDYVNMANVTAAQPIYAGGRIKNGYKLASLGVEFSQDRINLTKEEVLLKTEDFYWTIVALQEKEKTLLSYESLINNLKIDVGIAYDAGLIQKTDLLKVQIELSQIAANKLKLENGIALLKMSLCQHIGINYDEKINIADTLLNISNPIQLKQDANAALKGRNEYKMLNKAVTFEELKQKMATGEYKPQIAAGVQGLYLDMADKQNTYAVAFATLSVPISGWWGGSHKIQEHKIKVSIAQNNLEEKSELLLLQIDKAYRDLNESYMQIFVAESTNEQAKEHLRIAQDNYDAGMISTSDLLEAEAMMQKSQDELVDKKAIYKIRKAHYLRVVAQK